MEGLFQGNAFVNPAKNDFSIKNIGPGGIQSRWGFVCKLTVFGLNFGYEEI